MNSRTDRFPLPVYQEEATFILPAADLVTRLYEDLVPMSSHEYDMYEMMTLSLSALAVRNEAPNKITEIAGQYQRLAKIGKASEYNRDVEILSASWITFTVELLKLYDRLNLWDEKDCAHFYFKRFLGNDIVVTSKPFIQPRGVPPYVHHR
jgi:hypothetical protein